MSADGPEQMRVASGFCRREEERQGGKQCRMNGRRNLPSVERKSVSQCLPSSPRRSGKRTPIVHSPKSELRANRFLRLRPLSLEAKKKKARAREREREREREHAYVPALHKGPGVTSVHCATERQSIASHGTVKRAVPGPLDSKKRGGKKERKKTVARNRSCRPHDSTTSRWTEPDRAESKLEREGRRCCSLAAALADRAVLIGARNGRRPPHLRP